MSSLSNNFCRFERSCCSWCMTCSYVDKMSLVVKSERNLDRIPLSFESSEVFITKNSNRRPHLFEFILDILSEPSYSSIISWEGTSGQFRIINPDQVACLWGERNGRRNMTYQKFSRAMRYYYHKKVLTKIRGRKYTYKFDIRELEKQYGYKEAPSSREWSCHSRQEMPATSYCLCYPISGQHFPAFPPLMAIRLQQEKLGMASSQYAHSDR